MSRKVPLDALPPLYAVIGETVANWSIIETALGSWVAIIYQAAGGNRHAKVIPLALGRRMTFLRLCFNKITALQPFATDGRALLDRIGNIKDTRHMLVHGVVSNYSPDNHEFLFVRLDLDKAETMQVIKELSISAAKMLNDSGEAMAIATDCLIFAERLLQALVPEYKGQQLLRSI